MPDILIRNLDEAVLARIDEEAAREGLSRNEYLRRRLDVMTRPEIEVSVDDLKRSADLASDLLDPDFVRTMWE